MSKIEKRKLVNFKPLNLLMFDLFDRANHLKTVEDKIDLISFSSTMVHKDLL